MLVETQEPGAIENDEEGAELVQDGGEDGADQTQCGNDDEDGDENETPEQVLVDNTEGVFTEREEPGKAVEMLSATATLPPVGMTNSSMPSRLSASSASRVSGRSVSARIVPMKSPPFAR